MSEILQNTGVTLWSIRDDYDELQTSVFETLTGTGGKSNIRLIDEAIGNINSKLNGYYFEYSDDRLYICKKSENENIKRYPVTLNDNNGHIASKVDGSTITIDENGIVRGLPVDDALSSISTNPIQNKVVKAKVDEIEKNVSKNTEDIKKNGTNISNNTKKINSLETAVSSEKTRAESVENQLKTDLENGKKVWDDKYTKSEVDNKFSTLETNIDWKEAVNTFDDIATTYPTPDDGWTVNVKDTDYTYRYNGGKWVAISANAIPKATNEVDGLMTKEYAKKLDGLTKYTPDGTTITADEDGTLHGADTIQVDGITITRDDATKVIALAKTLQDKIALVDNKIDKANVANNLTTTEADFVLDARQGKALQDQLTTLNGSLGNLKVLTCDSFEALDTELSNMLTNTPYIAVIPGGDGMLFGLKNHSDYQRQLRMTYWDNVLYSRVKTNSTKWSEWVNVNDITKFIDIPSNANLNDIKFFNVGKYRCYSNVTAETVLNSPFKTAFTMEVYYSAGTSNYVAQKATEFATGHCKWRMRETGSGKLQDWVQLY